VLPTYGMTESLPIASNPLPPHCRDLVSVGYAAGPRLRLLDDKGEEVAQGTEAEVCVVGACVTSGYEFRAHMDTDPNLEGFTKDGWLRTGDKGYMNTEGFLCLTGRFKEIINRGAEKVSPLEIESVLRQHSQILDCLAFAAPHKQLGETVGLVLVPRPGSNLQPGAEALGLVQEFATQHGLNKKWRPECLVYMTTIPKGPTGKPMRIGLAKRVALPVMDALAACPNVWDASSGIAKAVEVGTAEADNEPVADPQKMTAATDSLGVSLKRTDRDEAELKMIYSLYGFATIAIIYGHYTKMSTANLLSLGLGDHPVALALLRHFQNSSRFVSIFTICFGYLESKERKFHFNGKREGVLILALFWNYSMHGPIAAVNSMVSGAPYHWFQDRSIGSMAAFVCAIDWYVRFMLLARTSLMVWHHLRVPAWLHLGIGCATAISVAFHGDPTWWTRANAYDGFKVGGQRWALSAMLYQYLLYVVTAYYGPAALQAARSTLGWVQYNSVLSRVASMTLLVSFPDVFYPNRPYQLLPLADQYLTDGTAGFHCAQAPTVIQGIACFVAGMPMDVLWISALAVVLSPGNRVLELVGRSSLGSYLLHQILMQDMVMNTGLVIQGLVICPSLPSILVSIASIPASHGQFLQPFVPTLVVATVVFSFVLVALVSGWVFDFMFYGFIDAVSLCLPQRLWASPGFTASQKGAT